MGTRTDAAAATRGALVRAASELLDAGGPDAVTLRAVGALAGVSRGAPYGHFENKEGLLAALAVDAWNEVADEVEHLRTAGDTGARDRLASAVLSLVNLGRQKPHLYALMFSTPANDPETTEAAGRLNGAFLAIVADAVGEADARRYGALVMATAHGIASLELSGHLAEEKWRVGGDELVRMLVAAVPSTHRNP
jgi:AcrR family transcriptional regulator